MYLRLNQGILYFQNVTLFQGTLVNVISFTLIRKEWSSLHRFTRNSQMFNSTFVTTNFAKMAQDFVKVRVGILLGT